MADLVLKKHKPFTVKIEGVRDEFKLPPLSNLSMDQIGIFTGITKETDTKAQGDAAKMFVLELCPELENHASDFELVQIFNAYFDKVVSQEGE